MFKAWLVIHWILHYFKYSCEINFENVKSEDNFMQTKWRGEDSWCLIPHSNPLLLISRCSRYGMVEETQHHQALASKLTKFSHIKNCLKWVLSLHWKELKHCFKLLNLIIIFWICVKHWYTNQALSKCGSKSNSKTFSNITEWNQHQDNNSLNNNHYLYNRVGVGGLCYILSPLYRVGVEGLHYI